MTHSKWWIDDEGKGGFLQKPGAGQRLIVCGIGSNATGFLHDAQLIFAANSKTGDYHDSMNTENFFKWMDTTVLPKILPGSVVVLDRVSQNVL